MNSLQPLIIESAQLMLIGMGSVFVILLSLILLINLVNKILVKLKLEDEPVSSRTALGGRRKKPVKSDNELIAVIGGAIAAYKKRHST